MSKYIVEYKSLNKYDNDTISLNMHKFIRVYTSLRKYLQSLKTL